MTDKTIQMGAIIQLHKQGKKNCEILKTLKLGKKKAYFVSRTIKKYKETNSLERRPYSVRKRTKRTPKMLRALKGRTRRNPCRKQKKLALGMGTSLRTMNRAINEDLGMKAYRKSYCHHLTDRNKEQRYKRCKSLISSHDEKKVENILFTDEKIFTIEEKINKSQNRVYGTKAKNIPKRFKNVSRSHHPASIMVWAGVSIKGKAPLHFVDPGVKMDAKYYQEEVLEKIVRPLNDSLFDGEDWTFQQDSAPSHRAKSTQMWLENNVPEFISATQWPAASPDLNPLDYDIWSRLELKVCSKRHKSLDSLKRSLIHEWNNLSMEDIRSAIKKWRPKLKQCVKAKGDIFES